MHHDHAPIGPRSRANRATITRQSGHDHASIVVLREARSTVRSLEGELDRLDVSARCSKIAEDHDYPMKGDEIATKIGRSWTSTCHQVSRRSSPLSLVLVQVC